MAQQRGLGRGLDALLGGVSQGSESQSQVASQAGALPLSQIRPNPDQPRRDFTDDALKELAESIRSKGVLQPVLVRPVPEQDKTRYELVAGERRWRASQIAGLTEIPALIRELTDNESLAIALVENLQREDLNPLEEARGIKELQQRMNASQEELSKAIGKSRSAIANILRLLQLPETIQNDLSSMALTSGHARSLMSVTDPEAQQALRDRIVAGNLSVRQAEAQAGHWRKHGQLPESDMPESHGPGRGNRAGSATRELDQELVDIQDSLGNLFGCQVRCSGTPGKGRISFAYTSSQEFQELVRRLSSLAG
jgi:ParB family chromosome partitioning protein